MRRYANCVREFWSSFRRYGWVFTVGKVLFGLLPLAGFGVSQLWEWGRVLTPYWFLFALPLILIVWGHAVVAWYKTRGPVIQTEVWEDETAKCIALIVRNVGATAPVARVSVTDVSDGAGRPVSGAVLPSPVKWYGGGAAAELAGSTRGTVLLFPVTKQDDGPLLWIGTACCLHTSQQAFGERLVRVMVTFHDKGGELAAEKELRFRVSPDATRPLGYRVA